jgi:hypothetical protein
MFAEPQRSVRRGVEGIALNLASDADAHDRQHGSNSDVAPGLRLAHRQSTRPPPDGRISAKKAAMTL